ncbi:glutathione S-transferase family protein [Roseateles chitosanitabidus]|uniref:glutathione S-transferase family protein n=1 Tax=Roseateles chitosanitabidus TaxID=65048 RepID=UPI0008357F9C|nr:glutathione S-transferase family protein [Roseateles chitosanitabidus]MBO9687003.1 glutathione S-transferase family protein [Roseateles chitosanitabidus]
MQLVIGNKNYSSWSMRPWVLLKGLDIAFEERVVRFDFEPGSAFYRALAPLTPTLKVPVLVDEGLAVWDSLAIVEYIAERFPDKPVWPRDARQRARARSLCAEMHSGFTQLRSLCPMNIDAELAFVGQRLLATEPSLHRDLARIGELWTDALAQSGGPFLFGEFGAVDAFFAPVVMRVTRYGLPLPAPLQAYVARMQEAPGVREWIADALAEKDFLEIQEPYRDVRGAVPTLKR